MIRIVDKAQEYAFAVKHAKEALRIGNTYCCVMPGLTLLADGWRYDDENGYIIFLDHDGNVKDSV